LKPPQFFTGLGVDREEIAVGVATEDEATARFLITAVGTLSDTNLPPLRRAAVGIESSQTLRWRGMDSNF
jgi:hypothetical protein